MNVSNIWYKILWKYFCKCNRWQLAITNTVCSTLSNTYLLKTADFQFSQTTSILPSLHTWLSSCEKNFEKWWFDEEEEGKEGRQFCQTKSTQHKIITNDNFSTEFFLFAKTTLYVCIDAIMFQKGELFVSTRILFWQSQKLIVLLVVTIPQSFILSFSQIWMILMLLYQCHDMNNNVDVHTVPFCLFVLLLRCQKRISNWIVWNVDLQLKCWFLSRIIKCILLTFYHT